MGNDWRVTPFAGFDYSYKQSEIYPRVLESRSQSVTSITSSRLHIPDQNFYEVTIGIKLSKDFRVGSRWIINPFIETTLVNSIGKIELSEHSVSPGMLEVYPAVKQTVPGFTVYNGSEWRTYGMVGDHFGGRLKVGMDASMNNRLDFGMSYSFEGRNRLQEHRFDASFGLSF